MQHATGRCFTLLLYCIGIVPAIVLSSVKEIDLHSSDYSRLSIDVWVHFSDKTGSDAPLSPRALARRTAAGFVSRESDAPVSLKYIKKVEELGGSFRNAFKWGNAVSFALPPGNVAVVRSLPFVSDVTLVRSCRSTVPQILKKKGAFPTGDPAVYGTAYSQLAMVNIPAAHEYIAEMKNGSRPGEKVLIAFFDSGFRLDHRCFKHLHERGAIAATYDFIDHDESVDDPDSVSSDYTHPYWGNDEHGTLALSLTAAYDPPYFCGAAWGADFLLARTENTYIYPDGEEYEKHTEEDNWAAAVVWAESLGVDIISSSLGYSTDFQDSVIVIRENGEADTLVDYLKSDLDGKTTIVSLAARGAVQRGVTVVNAIGNERYRGDTSLSAPADVEGVIAVGSVNRNGILSSFSSLGPAANNSGTPKPDVVAPGESIFMPDINAPGSVDYLRTANGTSFATPIVTGVCALVRQSHPGATGEQLREQLFRYCRFLPQQASVDNRYGRGLPDALASCMQYDDEFHLFVADTGGKPLAAAYITGEDGDTLGKTDGKGVARLRLVSDGPGSVVIRYGTRSRRVAVDSTPGWRRVYPCTLSLAIRYRTGRNTPESAVVRHRPEGVKEWLSETVDSTGSVIIEEFVPGNIAVGVQAAGSRSNTFTVLLREGVRKDTTIELEPVTATDFIVYPTVLHRSRHTRLTVRFAVPTSADTAQQEAKPLHIMVRTLNGELVWKECVQSRAVSEIRTWDSGERSFGSAHPGTYFLVLTYDKKKYLRKFIIAE